MRVFNTVLLGLFLLVLGPVAIFAAHAPVSDGDSIIFYGDGSSAALVKFVAKDLKDQLKERSIKIDDKGKKGAGIADLLANIEKDVLKKKPNLVIIAPGISDVYDAKKKASLEDQDLNALTKQLKAMVDLVQAKDIAVALATPCLAGEELSQPIDAALNQWSENIRSLCKELNIACCDLRGAALEYLQEHNVEKKSKGILTKDGVKISKDGAEHLAPALLKVLGMVKDGIGGRLTASDRIRIFSQSPYIFKSMSKRLDTALKAKFPDTTGPVKPSFAQVVIPSLMKAKEAPTKDVLTQNARVSFLYLGDEVRPKSGHNFAAFETMLTNLYAELKKSLKGKVYVFTLPSQFDKKDDAFHEFRKKMNAHIRAQAIENGFGVIEMYDLVEAKLKQDPSFQLVVTSGGNRSTSGKYIAMIETEITRVLGLSASE